MLRAPGEFEKSNDAPRRFLGRLCGNLKAGHTEFPHAVLTNRPGSLSHGQLSERPFHLYCDSLGTRACRASRPLVLNELGAWSLGPCRAELAREPRSFDCAPCVALFGFACKPPTRPSAQQAPGSDAPNRKGSAGPTSWEGGPCSLSLGKDNTEAARSWERKMSLRHCVLQRAALLMLLHYTNVGVCRAAGKIKKGINGWLPGGDRNSRSPDDGSPSLAGACPAADHFSPAVALMRMAVLLRGAVHAGLAFRQALPRSL